MFSYNNYNCVKQNTSEKFTKPYEVIFKTLSAYKYVNTKSSKPKHSTVANLVASRNVLKILENTAIVMKTI